MYKYFFFKKKNLMLLNHKMNVNGYNVLQELGSGSFANVYLAEDKLNKIKVALKIIKTQKLKNLGISRLEREIDLFEELQLEEKEFENAHIIKFIKFINDDVKMGPILVFEYCNYGSLDDLLLHKVCFSDENEIKHYLLQICEALHYLHKRNIIHHDIKMSNILLNCSQNSLKLPDDYKSIEIKLSDFDFARKLSNENLSSTVCGTPFSWGPESLESKGKNYTFKSEVWSLGIILFEMCTGKLPFPDCKTTKMLEECLNHQTIQFPTTLSKHLSSLLKSLLHLNPEKRPSLQELLHHPFFREEIPEECVVLNNYFSVSGDFEKTPAMNIPRSIPIQKIPIQESSYHSEYIQSSFSPYKNFFEIPTLTSFGRILSNSLTHFKHSFSPPKQN